MEMADLVKTIVQEVLGQLEARKARPCVFVLAKRDAALESKVMPLVSPWFPEGVDLVFFGEDFGGRTPVKHILPSLCVTSMADLAAGRAGSRTMETVLSLLLQGVSVEVLEFGYHDFAQTAPGALFDLYAGYEKTLASYGLRAFKTKLPDALRVRETLVTAEMVEKAAAEGYKAMLVPARANITPLAAETAADHQMVIRKQL